MGLQDKLASIKASKPKKDSLSEKQLKRKADLSNAVKQIDPSLAEKLLLQNASGMTRCALTLTKERIVILVNGKPVVLRLNFTKGHTARVTIESEPDVKIFRGDVFDRICTDELKLGRNLAFVPMKGPAQ